MAGKEKKTGAVGARNELDARTIALIDRVAGQPPAAGL